MRTMDVQLVDEHYYAGELFFEQNADRYDSYPRKGPKVFAGEYACHGSDNKKWNHFNAALVEAAYMTGIERNADIVAPPEPCARQNTLRETKSRFFCPPSANFPMPAMRHTESDRKSVV